MLVFLVVQNGTAQTPTSMDLGPTTNPGISNVLKKSQSGVVLGILIVCLIHPVCLLRKVLKINKQCGTQLHPSQWHLLLLSGGVKKAMSW